MKDVIGAIALLMIVAVFVIWQASEGNKQAIVIIEGITGESHEYERADP